MNKRLFIVTLVFAIWGTLFITASAKSEFVVENNTLVSYEGDEKNVVIPSEVDGEKIIFIDRFAFDTNLDIETVTISEGVEIIRSEAFKNCDNLRVVKVPESLVDICSYAFSGCYGLEPVELKSEWTTIDSDAYTDADENVRPSSFSTSDYTMNGSTIVAYNGTIQRLVVPDKIDGVTVTAIGESAFQGNTIITSVVIPNTVKTIGAQAFYSCTGLKTLKLSDNLTSCGKNAFAYCTSLTSVTIPGSLTRMGYGMFQNCTLLKNVKLCEGVSNTNSYTFNGCTALSEIEFPSTMATISVWAFGNCGFETLEIPSTVKTVDAAAYYRNQKLTAVYVPDSVTILGSQCFRGCSNVTEFRISPNVTYIQYRCFDGCRFTKFEVPVKATSIGNQAFYNCVNLNDFVVYDNTKFGSGVFDCNVSTNRKLVVYTPQNSQAEGYANTNGIASKPIVTENVSIIVSEDSLGTYGTINYPITDKVENIGMHYVPAHLAEDTEVPVIDIKYQDVTVNNGDTFMSLMTDIPLEAMDWTYIATPYVKLTDGTMIWGNSKEFGLNFITTKLTWEE